MSCAAIPSTIATRKPEVPSIGGIYVFYENDIPLYVGRTNNIKRRIRIHRSSDAMGSSFAYKLALEDAKHAGLDLSSSKNKAHRMAMPEFRSLFNNARTRVGEMSVKWVPIENSITQAIFEMYVHLELDTKYNDFDNH
jgi:hypothetical protein